MQGQADNIEAERINILKKYNLLDTLPDVSYDRITQLIAKLFNVPIVLIALVDADRIWFKSHFGTTVSQIVRDINTPKSAVLPDDMWIVEDVLEHADAVTKSFMNGLFNSRFCIAVPIKVKEGYTLGSLCIMDANPRKFAEWQISILKDLGEVLVNQIELNLATQIAADQQNQLLNIAIHDLRNPLTIIPLWAELIQEEKNNPLAVLEMTVHINNAASKMTRTINDLLESASLEANQLKLCFIKVNLGATVQTVVARNMILANAKNQRINLNIENSLFIYADEIKIGEIVDNLLNNAIKYSERNKNISVTVKQHLGKAIIEVADEGLGFTEEDKKSVFQRFRKLSSKPTGKEASTGLGLFIVRLFVEAHKGTISLQSKGKNLGAVFTVQIPAVEADL